VIRRAERVGRSKRKASYWAEIHANSFTVWSTTRGEKIMNMSLGLLASYMHQMSPFLWEVAPGVGIRWYGLAYLLGAVIGGAIVWWMAKRGRARLAPPLVSEFAIDLLIGAFVGGRVGFCLLYEPRLLGLIDEFPYWGVLAIQRGGMASHGGIIGMLLAAGWFSRKHNVPLLHLLDLACLVGPIGVFLGRLANFVNGELYGRECPPNLPWSVKFPKEIFAWTDEQMKGLAPIVEKVGIDPVDWLGWLRTPDLFEGVISNGLLRVVEAIEHHQPGVAEALEPVLTSRYPSQLVQAGLEGLLVFLLLAFLWAWPRKPGVITACFVVLYAIARTIGEQFRMPDHELGFELFGLTRGQELSLMMLVAGLATLVWVVRRPVPKEPGWLGPSIPQEREASHP
jgi:phosphatidylglycerol:prolipoprotein diacylglycerol transferase